LQRLLLLAALACPGCALLGPDWQEAAPATIASSFAPFRERQIAGEDAETFMRRRTAIQRADEHALRQIDLDLRLRHTLSVDLEDAMSAQHAPTPGGTARHRRSYQNRAR